MKCPNCGKELKTGQLYCESCGQEIQIVPDYDPLDELLIGREEPAEKTFSPSGKKTKNPNDLIKKLYSHRQSLEDGLKDIERLKKIEKQKE